MLRLNNHLRRRHRLLDNRRRLHPLKLNNQQKTTLLA
jgi:hypothetical protein